jgi:hypothetical protein
MTNPQTAAPGVAVEAKLEELLLSIDALVDLEVTATLKADENDRHNPEYVVADKATVEARNQLKDALRTALLAGAAGGEPIGWIDGEMMKDIQASDFGSASGGIVITKSQTGPTDCSIYIRPPIHANAPHKPDGVTITLRQAEQLLAFFGGHDAEVRVLKNLEGHPEGLMAYCVECPEEGSHYLGATEVDDDLANHGRHPPAPVRAPQEITDAEIDRVLALYNNTIESTAQQRHQMRRALEGFAASCQGTGALPAVPNVPADEAAGFVKQVLDDCGFHVWSEDGETIVGVRPPRETVRHYADFMRAADWLVKYGYADWDASAKPEHLHIHEKRVVSAATPPSAAPAEPSHAAQLATVNPPEMARELEEFRKKHWAHWNAAENLLIAHAIARVSITPPPTESKPALQKFNELMGDDKETPLERLRFFCSLAMNGQDWLDVEPFFAALEPGKVQVDAARQDALRFRFIVDALLNPSGPNAQAMVSGKVPTTAAEVVAIVDFAIASHQAGWGA